ncbi:ankyrin repeat domain-containing protein [Chryseobacterium sp.]|uniref:ankyrin repeat domain-containing protein n=1 Tax=Chryseobacterium sp. TaxID=1871047 RepID=UPI0025BC4084|nr:ankyrin repeat domain-containing protein [Chryseobacterium sp.]MBV8327446.1 ankyrin repeat domain-containing protein [Chryseobacterium sp.]
MNKTNTRGVFRYVTCKDLDNLKIEVNDGNVNSFTEEYGRNLLQEAIVDESFEIFDYLLTCGIDVNHSDKNGQTPLHFSVVYNNYEITKKLLSIKIIEINKKDKYGNNPLWTAVFNSKGYYEIVKLMMQHGADPASKNNNNKSPLDLARLIKDEELERILFSE